MSSVMRLAETRPRTYGGLLVALGLALIAFLRGYGELTGRASVVLVLLVPFVIVYGVHALVLRTTPSSLRGDRVTAMAMLVLSGAGSVLLWSWIAG